MPAKPAPASNSQLWTIQRLLAWTTDFFRQAGSASPRLDAEVLLASTLGCQRIDLYARFDQTPSERQRSEFRQLVKRRSAGEPVAYLTGHREFYSANFAVNPDVLIPRPETEHLVVEALDLLRARPADAPPPSVVDVGTGSGAIAVALALHAPAARVLATDIHPPALEIARQNALALAVADRIEFALGDLLGAVDPPRRFDLVVSNPPYVGHSQRDQLAADVVDFEPHIALFSGGPQGTEIIQRLLEQAPDYLVDGGYVIVELGPLIADQVRQIAESDGRFGQVRIKRDLAGLERLLIAQRRRPAE